MYVCNYVKQYSDRHLHDLVSPVVSVDNRQLVAVLQENRPATTGCVTRRLETRTLSWTCWRRHTRRSTGWYASTRWRTWRTVAINISWYHSDICRCCCWWCQVSLMPGTRALSLRLPFLSSSSSSVGIGCQLSITGVWTCVCIISDYSL